MVTKRASWMVAMDLGMVLENSVWDYMSSWQRWLKYSRGESFEHPMHILF